MIVTIMSFLGGLGIFLYGSHILSKGLQKLVASKMREYLATITSTRIKGIISGIIVTFFLQSSTVTNILVVGLAGSSIITLSQAFGIVLGSAIGTTLTVQILTFNITDYATLFIFIGVVFIVFVKRSIWQSIGQILLSIGFIFYGISLITSSLIPIAENDQFLQFLVSVSKNPLLFAIIAAFFTALMHSSAAMIIIGIAFVTSGILPLSAILPLVLGANVGSTIPVVISGISSNTEGKKLGLFYFVFKVTGVTLAMILLPYVIEGVSYLSGSAERQIAHFHTLFNVGITILFFPFLPLITKLFHRIFRKQIEPNIFKIELSETLLEVPEEALFNSKKEIVRLAELVHINMINELAEFITTRNNVTQIYEIEQIIDDSYVTIQKYLLKLGQKDLTSGQSNQEVKLLNILNDIEHIGDMVVQFLSKAESAYEKNIILNKKDEKQLYKLLDYVEETYLNSLVAFKDDDESLARKNIQNQSLINQFEKDLKFEHFNRLINNKEYNPNISAVYLDIVNQLLQIYHHSINLSRTVLGLI